MRAADCIPRIRAVLFAAYGPFIIRREVAKLIRWHPMNRGLCILASGASSEDEQRKTIFTIFKTVCDKQPSAQICFLGIRCEEGILAIRSV